jgi:hypothetical protein
VELIRPVLGTLAGNPEVAKEFIVAKHPKGHSDEEEAALPNVDEELRDATTFFPRSPDGQPIMWCYMVRGHMKAAAKAYADSGQFTKEQLKKFKLTSYSCKRTIDTMVFVLPSPGTACRAWIPWELPASDHPGWQELEQYGVRDEQSGLVTFERPLRAETMRGERIALSRSEMLPAGSKARFQVECLNAALVDWVRLWLDYGERMGYGQFRNGGFGQFVWHEV